MDYLTSTAPSSELQQHLPIQYELVGALPRQMFLLMKIMYTYIIKTRYIRFLRRTYIFISFGLLLCTCCHILLKAMVATTIIKLSCTLN